MESGLAKQGRDRSVPLAAAGNGVLSALRILTTSIAGNPMSLDEATVAKIAHLARIRLDESQRAGMAEELNNILGWVEQLREVDTDGVPPMTSVAPHGLRRRADEVTDGHYPERVLANAPESASGFYAVPKVVE